MKLKLLFIPILFLSLTAQSQEFDLGLKVGANFSKISDADDYDNRTGLRAGAFFAVKYDGIAIQPEIVYSEQGGKNDLGDFELNYVNIPVMLKLYILGDVINLQAGPQFGFVVDENFPTMEGVEQQVEANDFDFAGAVGIGADIPFGLQLDARYNYGLTKISDNTDGRNTVISVTLGYTFL